METLTQDKKKEKFQEIGMHWKRFFQQNKPVDVIYAIAQGLAVHELTEDVRFTLSDVAKEIRICADLIESGYDDATVGSPIDRIFTSNYRKFTMNELTECFITFMKHPPHHDDEIPELFKIYEALKDSHKIVTGGIQA